MYICKSVKVVLSMCVEPDVTVFFKASKTCFKWNVHSLCSLSSKDSLISNSHGRVVSNEIDRPTWRHIAVWQFYPKYKLLWKRFYNLDRLSNNSRNANVKSAYVWMNDPNVFFLRNKWWKLVWPYYGLFMAIWNTTEFPKNRRSITH